MQLKKCKLFSYVHTNCLSISIKRLSCHPLFTTVPGNVAAEIQFSLVNKNCISSQRHLRDNGAYQRRNRVAVRRRNYEKKANIEKLLMFVIANEAE